MSIPTVTAARILEGQLRNETGEENFLSWEKFPWSAFSKTYNTDSQVADSAGTATAFLSGVKTTAGKLHDCMKSRMRSRWPVFRSVDLSLSEKTDFLFLKLTVAPKCKRNFLKKQHFLVKQMHLSLCNLSIPPPPARSPPASAYHGHLTPSLSPGVGNLTLEPLRGWWIWHQATKGGKFDRSYTTSEEKMLSDLADKILRSWPNGWPKMGRRNSGTLLNVSTKFLYPILIWKRPSGTYSVLFSNDLAQLDA